MLFDHIIKLYYYCLFHIGLIVWFNFGLSETFFVITIQLFNNITSLPLLFKTISTDGPDPPLPEIATPSAAGSRVTHRRWATRWRIHR